MVRDKINSLPDSVLLDILSLLQTKDAIATSLLSKRWKSLWRYLPKLEFRDKSFRRVKFFIQFVDAVLLLVDLKYVKTFVLKCERSSVHDIKLNIWLNALLSHNSITHLELNFRKQRVNLPTSVFMCNTISVLKLTRVKVSNLSRVNLPTLKVLHLKTVEISNSQCVLPMLLPNCPYLEELVIKNLFLPHVHLTPDIGRFERLLLADIPPSLFQEEVFSNIRFLCLNVGHWKLSNDMPMLHNLIHLEIHELCHIDYTIVRCLQRIPNLQSLVVFGGFVNAYYGDSNSSDDEDKEGFMKLATPEVPTCVSSHMKELALFNFLGSKSEFEFVRFIMENARVLSTIIVGSPNADKGEGLETLIKLSSYPRCSAKCRLIFDLTKKGTLGELSNLLTIRRLFAASSFGFL